MNRSCCADWRCVMQPTPDCSWTRLTATGSAALQVYSLQGMGIARLLPLLFKAGARESGALRHGHVFGVAGVIDEVLLAGPHADGHVEVALHGSPAVAHAFEALLHAHGATELRTSRVDVHSERDVVARGAFAPKTLELLYGAAFTEFVTLLRTLRSSAARGFIANERMVLLMQVERLLERAACGLCLISGVRVLLLGAPNAGKSTLWNALIGEDRAIVSSESGTTRDVLCASVDAQGWPLLLFDAAGLGSTPAGIEADSAALTLAAATHADILVLAQAPDAPVPAEIEVLARGRAVVRINTKCDLAVHAGLNVSALTGEGLPALRRRLLEASVLRPLLNEAPLLACPFTLRQQCLLATLASALRNPAVGAKAVTALVEELGP